MQEQEMLPFRRGGLGLQYKSVLLKEKEKKKKELDSKARLSSFPSSRLRNIDAHAYPVT